MCMTRWCLMAVLGTSLLGAGCDIAGISKQEDLGQGIVRGTLGALQTGEVRLAMPTNVFSLKGQVTAVEGGAYVLQEFSGIERRVAHDENTRIDRPAHVGDRIEAFVDDKGRAVLIRNIDRDEGSQ
jgi:C4-type Zn-finger protein